MPRLLAMLAILALFMSAREDFRPSQPHAGAATTAALELALPEAALRYAAADHDATRAARGIVPLRAPASAGRLADPAILVDGGTYYVYATRTGQLDIPAAASTDLRHWSPLTNALPALPAWAERGRTWAPSVVRHGGQYVLWYTVRHRDSGRMCISVATGTQPLGPYHDRSEGPAICQFERGGSIDPDVFVDEDGAAYLVWKSEDNVFGQPTSLWGAALDESGTRLGEARHLLARGAEWQGLIIEGPALTRHGGGYYLFYGANAWQSTSAAIGFARCESPLGPCEEQSTRAPWLAGDATVLGPSGPQFSRSPSGATLLAYHGWDQCVGRGCRRALFVDELQFRGGQPVALPR
jgi:beta-xylosidase